MGRFDKIDVEAFKGDRRDFERWREDCRNEVEGDESPSFDVGEVLAPLLVYLADGYATGVIAKRAVALLVVVAPHLLSDVSYSEIAERLGCRPHDITCQVRVLREAMPALKGGFRREQTSTSRFVSLNQLRYAARNKRLTGVDEARKRHYDECQRASALKRELAEQKRLANELRFKRVEAKKAANARALEAMREFDRVTGLCPEIPRRDEGQPSALLGARPDGSAAVGVVCSVEARSRPRREGRWF